LDRATRIFWALIVLLLSTSLYFALELRQRQRAVDATQNARDATTESEEKP
jgi:hypothetical protein